MKNSITLLLFFFLNITFAQVGSIDTTFNPSDSGLGNGDGFDAVPANIQYQDDGKMIVTGVFTTYNGTNKSRIVRLNADGSIDNTFLTGTGFNATVSDSKLLSDGKILVVGDFTSYNSESCSKIIRLNANGTIDTTFGATTVGFANHISVQNDGKILISGNFLSVNNVPQGYFARLHANGTLDTSFDTGIGFNIPVFTSIVQADGKIICGGAFTNFNGQSANRIVRLNPNGTLDTSFIYGTGFNNSVNDFKIQSDSKILVAGYFVSYNGNSHQKLVRLNTDGSVDTSFAIGTGTDQFIRTMLLQDDGKIVIAGDFTTFNQISIKRIARISNNGTLDTSFDVGTGANGEVSTLEQTTSGKLMLGGIFTFYKGIAKGRIISINQDGSIDNTFNPGSGSNAVVWTMCHLSDNKILIGGDFTSYNGIFNKYIAKLHPDGTLDTSFNPGAGPNSSVYGIAESEGKYIIAGNFNSFNNIPTNFITKLNSNGSVDPTFNIGTGANSGIYNLTLQNDKKIIIIGTFTLYNGVVQNRIARLNNDGSLDTSFNIGTGANSTIESVAIQSDGKIVVGGIFTTFNGVSRMRIARLNTDGSLDTTFNPIVGGTVNSISVQNDGKLLISGSFNTINSTSAPKVARLNTDGTLDTNFNVGTGSNAVTVSTILATSSGKVIVGGYFTSFNGGTQKHIVQLNNDGSTDTNFKNGNAANNLVFSLTLQNDGKLLIGGSFTAYNQTGRNRLMRINTEESTLNTPHFQIEKLSIFPNPTTGLLNIKGNNLKEPVSLSIIDMNGRNVYFDKNYNTEKMIDIRKVQSGIYILNIKTKEKNYTQKIIKN